MLLTMAAICSANAKANDPMLEPAAAPHGDDAAGGEAVVKDPIIILLTVGSKIEAARSP